MQVDNVRSSALSKLAPVTEQILKGNVGKQYAAICYRINSRSEDDIEVLLITSRDSGRWVIPKGWGMPKKKPYEVAAREAWEEAGVRGKVKKKPLGYYTYVKKVRVGEHVPSLVQVHLLRVVNSTLTIQKVANENRVGSLQKKQQRRSMKPNLPRCSDALGISYAKIRRPSVISNANAVQVEYRLENSVSTFRVVMKLPGANRR